MRSAVGKEDGVEDLNFWFANSVRCPSILPKIEKALKLREFHSITSFIHRLLDGLLFVVRSLCYVCLLSVMDPLYRERRFKIYTPALRKINTGTLVMGSFKIKRTIKSIELPPITYNTDLDCDLDLIRPVLEAL